MIKKPLSWILVLYEVPSEPSKLKVRVWREFKKLGAIYPQMSLCILPDNEENAEKIKNISKIIQTDGKLINISIPELEEKEHAKILDMYRKERDKQYEEIIEECHEFVDEIEFNIKNKKLTQEEVDEMEEVLDGLYRWYNKALALDWLDKSSQISELKNLLKKCHEAMDRFAEMSFPNK